LSAIEVLDQEQLDGRFVQHANELVTINIGPRMAPVQVVGKCHEMTLLASERPDEEVAF
jgi:hypothetical protein